MKSYGLPKSSGHQVAPALLSRHRHSAGGLTLDHHCSLEPTFCSWQGLSPGSILGIKLQPTIPVDIASPSGVFLQLSDSWSLWKHYKVWRPESPVAKVPNLSSSFPEQMWGSRNLRKGSLLCSSLSQKNGVEWSLAVNKSKKKPMQARDHWKKSANP